jgi:hypothetical protein
VVNEISDGILLTEDFDVGILLVPEVARVALRTFPQRSLDSDVAVRFVDPTASINDVFITKGNDR